MKKIKPLLLIVAVSILIGLTAAAFADTALVVTPKGPLNLRKSPTTNSNRIASIPNHETIEILDVDGEWAKAVYNGKTGFVKTEFLRIASQLTGKTVYENDYGMLFLHSAPDGTSPVLQPADNLAGILVDSVEDGWAATVLIDGTTAYADAAQLSYQVQTPPKSLKWIAEAGEIAQECSLRLTSGGSVTLSVGEKVTVTELSNIECLVHCEKGCGYVPMASVRLYGPEDSEETAGTVSREKALDRAMEALRKNYKGVANESLTRRVAVYDGLDGQVAPYYHCGFFDAQGTYVYGVLVNAEKATVLYTGRYTSFASAVQEPVYVEPAVEEPGFDLPEAEPDLSAWELVDDVDETEPAADLPQVEELPGAEELPQVEELPAETEPDAEPLVQEPISVGSNDQQPAAPVPPAETPVVELPELPAADAEPAGDVSMAYTDALELGEVVDIEVEAWTDYQIQYIISKDGQPVSSSGPVNHFTAAYRPKEAGNYTLTVMVTDENGGNAMLEADFTVAEADVEGLLYDVYSQLDGWWANTYYYTRSMEESGAPLFTLTHGLERIGLTLVDGLPENLAVSQSFVDCQTEDGVDNAKVIKTAAEAFGFTTEDAPITDAARISELLKAGAVFSFTNEKGNTVLAAGLSEDGTKVLIVDAAPGLSFDTIAPDTVFIQNEDGAFQAITSWDEDPDSRWFFATGAYGGLEYWQNLADVAPNGLLLIQAKEEAK